jgi:PTH2 family peptidyl-tRNA hydrolase
MTLCTKPRILPALKLIHDQIKGDTESIVLFENGSYILLNKEDTVDSVIDSVGLLESDKFANVKFHYFKSHLVMLCMQPDYPSLGNLKVYPIKDIDPMEEAIMKQEAMNMMQQDMLEKKIVVDSRVNDLNDLNLCMYLLVNTDLKMQKGKTAAQVGHAVGYMIEGLAVNPTQDYIDWKESHGGKIVLKATEDELLNYLEVHGSKAKDQTKLAIDSNCVCVRDMGLTQIPADSLTVVGFVPMYKADVPEFIPKLKLM